MQKVEILCPVETSLESGSPMPTVVRSIRLIESRENEPNEHEKRSEL
jgi:hypothetical protein